MDLTSELVGTLEHDRPTHKKSVGANVAWAVAVTLPRWYPPTQIDELFNRCSRLNLSTFGTVRTSVYSCMTFAAAKGGLDTTNKNPVFSTSPGRQYATGIGMYNAAKGLLPAREGACGDAANVGQRQGG